MLNKEIATFLHLIVAVTTPILREAFECCGKIEHIRAVQALQGCRGLAFIRFLKPESCELALKLHGTKILDREIRVERFQKKKKEKKVKMEKTSKPQKPNKLKKGLPKAEGNGESSAPGAAGDHDKKMKKKKNKAKVKEFMGTKSVDNKKVMA